MADVMPDYHVTIQQLRMRLAGFAHNVERYKLEIIQSESKRKEAIHNIKATQKAIEETKIDLAALEQEHGKPEEPVLDE
jgi:hypothetical protein